MALSAKRKQEITTRLKYLEQATADTRQKFRLGKRQYGARSYQQLKPGERWMNAECTRIEADLTDKEKMDMIKVIKLLQTEETNLRAELATDEE